MVGTSTDPKLTGAPAPELWKRHSRAVSAQEANWDGTLPKHAEPFTLDVAHLGVIRAANARGLHLERNGPKVRLFPKFAGRHIGTVEINGNLGRLEATLESDLASTDEGRSAATRRGALAAAAFIGLIALVGPLFGYSRGPERPWIPMGELFGLIAWTVMQMVILGVALEDWRRGLSWAFEAISRAYFYILFAWMITPLGIAASLGLGVEPLWGWVFRTGPPPQGEFVTGMLGGGLSGLFIVGLWLAMAHSVGGVVQMKRLLSPAVMGMAASLALGGLLGWAGLLRTAYGAFMHSVLLGLLFSCMTRNYERVPTRWAVGDIQA